jgi:sec-independent protein translocase protein TatC
MADNEQNPDTNFEPELSGSKFRAITSATSTDLDNDLDADLQPSQSTELALATVDTAKVAQAQETQESQEVEPGDPHTMTVVEHLDELRWRIMRSVGYLAAAFITALFLTKDVLRILQKPAGNMEFQALSIEEPLLVFFKVASYLALIIASPFILFEVGRFVAPGLTKQEKRIVSPVVFGSPLLFCCGAIFAYYCLLPPMLNFFGNFSQGISPINQRLDYYISLVCSILLYMGLCFQIPIVIFTLAMAGLVTSKQLLKVWRYAVFGSGMVACVLTPDPTAFSMLIVTAALTGLYFVSIILLKLFGK